MPDIFVPKVFPMVFDKQNQGTKVCKHTLLIWGRNLQGSRDHPCSLSDGTYGDVKNIGSIVRGYIIRGRKYRDVTYGDVSL
jgi:hypothetical protein